ncbi:oxidoreductase [Actinotalea ferrariae CF5-4]|uniref:Oxidoreductase n=1 Tax=Actinotalea ferrariae CF5-4 TaxID=948458 RepID=A0A021VTY6_9CELL|nr:NADH:flavin oxidoreductase/NADH oxidase [Actinotalea ferrariae]EYR62532.1 oxidoreductase [Actinotalea ferrariae CF5-4]
MPHLLQPLSLRGVTARNRAWLAPMCQYSSVDGLVDDWHVVHLGSRAVGGFGLVMTEAAAVVPEGRITPHDAGLWNHEHVVAWSRVVRAVHAAGALAGVQLAHAGRKASTHRPWATSRGSVALDDGGWATFAPSAVAFPGLAEPRALTVAEIGAVVEAFADAARRADAAGFDLVEVHAAHGYLLHQFLSPLSNHRTDAYGGTTENRARLLREVVAAVRAAWPDHKPLVVRVSATDWVEGGLEVEDVAAVCATLAPLGVDLVDVSSGGNALADIPVGPGYQVPLARRVREVSGLPVSAVGMLTDGPQVEKVLRDGGVDAVMVGRAALRDPYWVLRAAHELGVPVDGSPAQEPADDAPGAAAPRLWPAQYLRGTWG